MRTRAESAGEERERANESDDNKENEESKGCGVLEERVRTVLR